MNKRIRELADQTDENLSNVIRNDEWLQKFAELIVRECISIVEDAVTHREPASTYVDKIEEHFGVEE